MNKQERAKKIIVAICEVLDGYNHRFDVTVECNRHGCTFYFSVKSFGLMAILPPELLSWSNFIYIDNAHFYEYADEYLIARTMYQVSGWLHRPDYIDAYSKIIWAQA